MKKLEEIAATMQVAKDMCKDIKPVQKIVENEIALIKSGKYANSDEWMLHTIYALLNSTAHTMSEKEASNELKSYAQFIATILSVMMCGFIDAEGEKQS